jgi:hypothetical protein
MAIDCDAVVVGDMMTSTFSGPAGADRGEVCDGVREAGTKKGLALRRRGRVRTKYGSRTGDHPPPSIFGCLGAIGPPAPLFCRTVLLGVSEFDDDKLDNVSKLDEPRPVSPTVEQENNPIGES